MLAEAWAVLNPLKIFRGFGGGGNVPPVPPWRRHWHIRYLLVFIVFTFEGSIYGIYVLVYRVFFTWISSNSSAKKVAKCQKCMELLFEEISISSKLSVYRANQYQIRNQRPRLRRNRLFLGRKAGGVVKQLRLGPSRSVKSGPPVKSGCFSYFVINLA